VITCTAFQSTQLIDGIACAVWCHCAQTYSNAQFVQHADSSLIVSEDALAARVVTCAAGPRGRPTCRPALPFAEGAAALTSPGGAVQAAR